MNASEERARMREALREASADAVPSEDAPSPETIWAAVQGELPRREAEAVFEAAFRDPAAHEELRLALAVQDELSSLDDVRPAAGGSRRWRPWLAVGVAAAAALVLWVARPSVPPPDTPDAEYRGDQGGAQSLVEAPSLPADGFELAWEAEMGAHYELRLSTDAPALLLRKRGLTESRFIVPASTFDGVPSGTRILWQVDIVRPDNSRIRSATYVVRLE
jgi:hypothetical protein